MKFKYWIIGASIVVILAGVSIVYFSYVSDRDPKKFDDEIEHFKYGSIGAEVDGYPYVVWQTLPKLFPERAPQGWATFGFSSEPEKPLPVGVSVRKYGIPRVGLNCAACHTSTVNNDQQIILGAPANKLDLEKYLHFLIETSDDPRFTPDNIIAEAERTPDGIGWMDRLVYRYFIIPKLKTTLRQVAADNQWRNSRPEHGPGRTDAGNPWRLHFQMHPEQDSLVSTVDFPAFWNQRIRQDTWLHWDGNNNSLQERNLSAALAGGANEDSLDHPSIERVAAWSLVAPPPPYPFEIDQKLADTGKELFETQCASCHSPGGSSYGEVTPITELGTDRQRLDLFSEELLRNFATVGKGKPWQFRHYRKSNGYANVALDGIWARAPYLHNGSVPSLFDLLTKPTERPAQFFRGCDTFDQDKVGFLCNEGFLFVTTETGNSNGGHIYGTDLSLPEQQALVEYFKNQMKLKRPVRRIFYIGGGFLLIVIAAITIYIILRYDPPPHSQEAITARVDRLNEGAAVQVPHKSLDNGKTRSENPELFEKVERGETLSENESIQYRVIYQELLQRNQKYLNRFDWNLTVMPNVGMEHQNNVSGEGIEGSHDHHDESARSNYRDMRDSVRRLSEAQGLSGSFTRIKNAISAYKDLTDILLHLATAPQTKSIPYIAPATAPTDKFELIFENILREFKLAQFQPVNSPGYNEHIILALNSYDELVEAIQAEVYANLTPVERTLSGTWGGWQSLSPADEDYEATRIARKKS